MKPFLSHSPDETIAFAEKFARHLKAGDIICLEGTLGAGKTTFVKGLAEGLCVKPAEVSSPTFIIMNYYKGKLPVYHFDLYRLENPKEMSSVHFDEYFYGEGISLIEWPGRLGAAMPKEYIEIKFAHEGETERSINIRGIGEDVKARLAKINL